MTSIKRQASEITGAPETGASSCKRRKEARSVLIEDWAVLHDKTYLQSIVDRGLVLQFDLKEFVFTHPLESLPGLASTHRVEVIHISSCRFKPDLESLAHAYSGSAHLTTLQLLYTYVGDVGATAIGTWLLCHPDCRLETLDLVGNSIESAGLSNLAKSLASNKSVRHLTFAKNPNGFTSATTNQLADVIEVHPTLENIQLDGNALDWMQVESICRAVARNGRLKTFALCGFKMSMGHPFAAAAVLDMIRETKSLETLRLPAFLLRSEPFWLGIREAMACNYSIANFNILTKATFVRRRLDTLAAIKAHRERQRKNWSETNLWILGTYYRKETTSPFGWLPLEILYMIIRWHTPPPRINDI